MTYDELKSQWTSGAEFLEARTSGSTGSPKMIQLPRSMVKESAWRTIRAFSLTRDSRLHSCLSADTVGGKMQCIRALELGAQFTAEPPSNTPLFMFGPADWLTLVSVVPSQVHHILDRLDNKTLPFIEALLIGGSPIPPTLRERIAASPLRAWESYGMTETASHIAVRRVSHEDVPFTPLPGVEVSLTETGCLRILLPGQQPVVTNDLAALSPEGFRIIGRYDNVIISGGRKIIPEEIEAMMSAAGCEATVAPAPDDKWGEKAVAVITSEENRRLAEEAAAAIEPHWKRPKEIIVAENIPLTPSGKTDRPALKSLLARMKANNSAL